MKRSLFLLLFVITALAVFCPYAKSSTDVIKKKYQFTIPAMDEKYFNVNVPQGAKKISAVVSGQNQMLNLKIYGPANGELCKNSTWSYLSNWRKPLKCSAGIVRNARQRPGIWKVKLEGAVHKNKADKIKTVSGTLTVYITVENSQESIHKNNDLSLPIVNRYKFTIPARGKKYFLINIPQGAKKIRAVISGQNQMLNLKIYGPADGELCKNSTWSYLSNWRKPLKCSAGIVRNARQHPGIWKVKLEGAVHRNKADKIKTVSGTLTVYVD